jgi:hypothetical protein
MRKYICHIILLSVMNLSVASAQPVISDNVFFKEDALITIDLSTDLKKITSEKKLNQYQPATVTFHFPDSSVVTEDIRLSARGEFRRKNCYVPTMWFDFRNPSSPKLAPLKRLKLVCGCGLGAENERLVLKEFLVYKIYNFLTDMSFRVRLLRINYKDTRGKIKPYSQYAFFIEDVDEMAKRNKCYEVEKITFNTQKTDRRQMTLVALFQYMIGNTDWAVPNYHNIKLMRPKGDSVSYPYTVPYDFDFCGVVNASYASPQEELGTSSVTERVYRGFSRTMEELQSALDIFRNKKEAIKTLVMNFELLNLRSREDLMGYLDEFYKQIGAEHSVRYLFIESARTN